MFVMDAEKIAKKEYLKKCRNAACGNEMNQMYKMPGAETKKIENFNKQLAEKQKNN